MESLNDCLTAVTWASGTHCAWMIESISVVPARFFIWVRLIDVRIDRDYYKEYETAHAEYPACV